MTKRIPLKTISENAEDVPTNKKRKAAAPKKTSNKKTGGKPKKTGKIAATATKTAGKGKSNTKEGNDTIEDENSYITYIQIKRGKQDTLYETTIDEKGIIQFIPHNRKTPVDYDPSRHRIVKKSIDDMNGAPTVPQDQQAFRNKKSAQDEEKKPMKKTGGPKKKMKSKQIKKSESEAKEATAATSNRSRSGRTAKPVRYHEDSCSDTENDDNEHSDAEEVSIENKVIDHGKGENTTVKLTKDPHSEKDSGIGSPNSVASKTDYRAAYEQIGDGGDWRAFSAVDY